MSAPVREIIRPDGRCLVRSNRPWTSSTATAASEVAERRRTSVLAHIDERAFVERAALADAGFSVSRREVRVVIDVHRAVAALEDASLPEGVSMRSAADVDEDSLRLLDDDLRQDVPGTSGWKSTPEEFRDHTFADPDFDPRTYLVAVDGRTDSLIGLVRIWMSPSNPRLGLLAVRRAHRRHGVGSALMAHALRGVWATGAPEVSSEHEVANRASRAIAERLGARRVGITLELVYEPRSPTSPLRPLTGAFHAR